MIRCLSIATVLTGMAITLNAQNMKPLTPEEERVIVRKGTEAPFSGKYYLHDEDGTYRWYVHTIMAVPNTDFKIFLYACKLSFMSSKEFREPMLELCRQWTDKKE